MEGNESCIDCSLGSCALYTLTKNEVQTMENQTHKTRFMKGEIIWKQDTPLNSILYLRTGFVKEFMAYDNDPDQVIQLIKPRSYIGLQGLYTNSTSIFSYQAITNVGVCFIEKDVLSSLIRRNGSFAQEILIFLSQESLSNHKRFLSLNQTQIFGKVAGLIIYLSEEIYNNEKFEVNLKRAELGQMIASTRESVTRALKWFHNEAIIKLDRNSIQIIDYQRLSDISKRG